MLAWIRVLIAAITTSLLLVGVVTPASLQQFRAPWMRPGVALVVPGTAIGPIRLGMPIQDVMQILGKPRSSEILVGMHPMMFYPQSYYIERYGTAAQRIHYWFVLEGASSRYVFDPTFLVVEDTRGKVGAVGARFHRMFRTASSLGIGSTEAEIKQAIGNPDRSRNYITDLMTANTQKVFETELFYLSSGIRFTILLDPDSPYDKFKDAVYEVLIFCKRKKAGDNWELDPNCADAGAIVQVLGEGE